MPLILFLLYNLMGSATAYLGIPDPDFQETGSCATVRLQPNFKINQYQGLWWEILAVPNKYVASKFCTIHNFTLAGSSLKVYTSGLDESENKVKQKSVLSPNMEAERAADLLVEVPGVPTAPYQVLATDYRNYSCVYSCMDFMGFKAEFAWVFSRSPHFGPKSVEKCNAVFRDFKIDPTILKKTSQGKMCPYYHHLTEIIKSNENFIDSIFGQPVIGQRNVRDKSTEVVPTSAVHPSPTNNLIPTALYPTTITSQIAKTMSTITPLNTTIPNTFHNSSNYFPIYIPLTSYFNIPYLLNFTTETGFIVNTYTTVTPIPVTSDIITMVTTSTLNQIKIVATNTAPETTFTQAVPSSTINSSSKIVIPTSIYITTEIIPGTATSQLFPTSVTILKPRNKCTATQITDPILPTPQPYVGSASAVSTSWIYLLVILIIHCY